MKLRRRAPSKQAEKPIAIYRRQHPSTKYTSFGIKLYVMLSLPVCQLHKLHNVRITTSKVFNVLLTVYPCIIFFKWSQLGAHYFLVNLFQLLYIFRATICPSSGELTVVRHWYFFTLYGWLSVLHSQPYRVKNTSVAIYSNFSWWWAHSCPKHVEKLK